MAVQGVVEVEERLRIDEKALEAYLQTNIAGFEGTIEVKKFGYGASNPTYFMTTSAGQKYVLRKKPPGKIIKGAHAVEREYRVMKALGAKSFQVPQMHVLCEDVDVIGTAFYVMSFEQGPIPDNGLKKLSAERRRPAMLAIVDTLARLHNFDPAELGLMEPGNAFGQASGFYERQIKTMLRTSEAQVKGAEGKVSGLELASMPALLAQFEHHMPHDRSCIIHGDYKPDNVILSEGDATPQVVGILDWELSTIGHPLSDLANLCLPYHLGMMGSMLSYGPFDMSDSSTPTEEEVHRAYCSATGVPFPIPDWTFSVAFACFRLGVIVQGVSMRAATGQGSQKGGVQQAEGMAMMSNELCNLGLRLMDEAYGARSKL